MNYYIDCEFDGFKGPLLSMGIVREDGYSFYATKPILQQCDPWVAENVVPIMYNVPAKDIDVLAYRVPSFAPYLEKFFKAHDDAITVISDWPDDIKYLCEELITGPGTMVDIRAIEFYVERVDAYPTKLRGAIQHNAWWDAQALRYYFPSNPDQLEFPL